MKAKLPAQVVDKSYFMYYKSINSKRVIIAAIVPMFLIRIYRQ
jgi:hypothetical protein